MNRLFPSLALIALLAASTLLAAIPQRMSYQGFLNDSSGNPLNETVALTATIYSDSLGTSALWTESHAAVIVTAGSFSVVLGSATPIPASVFTGAIRWLGIRVNSDSEMRPLRPLLSTPAAFRALNADSAAYAKAVADNSVTSAKIVNGTIQLGDIGQNSATAGEVIKWTGSAWDASPEEPSAGGWTDAGTHIGMTTTSDSVAIGIAVPAAKLHVEGDIRLSQGGDIVFGNTECKINSGTDDLIVSATDCIYLTPGGGIRIYDRGAANWMLIDPEAKEVGIGTMAPEDMVHIENSAASGAAFLRVESSATSHGETGIRFQTPQNRWHLRMDDYTNNNIPAGALSLRSQDGALEALTVLEDGRVGIGTTSPTRKLQVSGSVQVRDTLYAGALNPALISAGRQPNEPGMAMNMSISGVSLGHSNVLITEETITVPDSGYVLAFGMATGSMDHTWGDNDDIEITITKSSAYLPPTNRARVRIPMNAGSGSYVFTLSPIATFYIDEPGEHRYSLYGHTNGPAATEISYARLTLLYVPTWYGTSYWESLVADEDVPASIQGQEQVRAEAGPRLPQQLPDEMKSLVQGLVAEEVLKIRQEYEARIKALESKTGR